MCANVFMILEQQKLFQPWNKTGVVTEINKYIYIEIKRKKLHKQNQKSKDKMREKCLQDVCQNAHFSNLKNDIFYKTGKKRQQKDNNSRELWAKNINRSLTKKYNWLMKIQKIFHLTNNFKCKWKQDITFHLSDWQRLGRFLTPRVVEGVVTQAVSYNVNGWKISSLQKAIKPYLLKCKCSYSFT